MKRLKIYISLLLILSFLMSAMPTLAADAGEITTESIVEEPLISEETTVTESTPEVEATILREEESLRGKYEKHFLMSDGTYQAVVYNEPIHYKTATGWVEVDNTLTLQTAADGTAQYTTADGVTDVTFSRSFDEQLVTMRQDNYSLAWGVQAVSNAVTPILSTAEAELVTADLNTFTAEEQKTMAAKSSSTIQYRNALAQDVDLEYIVLPSRVKENIILNSAQNIAGYVVTVYTENITARLLENREIEFVNADGEVIFTMTSPYMYDSAGELSEDIEVELIDRGDVCYIFMTPNADWLNDQSRVYPITIDPQVTTSSNAQNIIDNYVMQGSGVQNNTLDRLYIGKKSGAMTRSYIRFTNMPTIPTGSSISVAQMTVWLTSGTSTAYSANAYMVTGGNWQSGTICWDNQPAANTLLQLNIGHNNKTKYSFSCLKAVQKWYTNSTTGQNQNYGIMMLYSSQNINDYNTFYSADHTTTSQRPSIVITYSRYEAVNAISIVPEKTTITADSATVFHTAFTPSTATNKAVTWSSSNSLIAQINASGVITGIAPGTATITCTSDDSGVTDTCTITVTPASYVTMSLNTPKSGILTKGQHFWYQFTPTETGYYTFCSDSTSVDVKAYLYSNTAYIVDDDNGGEGVQFEIRRRLIAGTTYQLRVQGTSTVTTGSFTVSVSKGWPQATMPAIYTRNDWGAVDKIESRLEERTREPERIIYHHSANKFSSTDLEECKAEIRRIQNLHMVNEEKCDIAYHFIIDPAGRIWQGAEIDDYKRGHAEGYFDDIGVLVLGDFENRLANGFVPNTLNDNQKSAMIAIGKWLCYKYNLSFEMDNCPITTHRQVVPSTVCPGETMAPWVETTLLDTILYWRE